MGDGRAGGKGRGKRAGDKERRGRKERENGVSPLNENPGYGPALMG